MDMFDVFLLSDSLSGSQGRPRGSWERQVLVVVIWAQQTGIIALAHQELGLDKSIIKLDSLVVDRAECFSQRGFFKNTI